MKLPALPAWARRLAAEPLAHFLLIGAILFAAIALVRGWERPTIRIEARDIDQLGAYWEQQMQRPPTKQELAAMIDERVNEELLAREAVRLGLDKGDMIVRRRLAQKMAFASEDASVPQASEATLRAWYSLHTGQFAAPAKLTLRQVFFSADRTGVQPAIAAREALEKLQKGESADGDPSLLPTTYAEADPRELARDFGPDFVKLAESAPTGRWVGPVASPFGMHLLRVEGRQASAPQPFEAVRSEVQAAWLAERREQANAAFLQNLRRRYRVVITGAPAS